MTLLTQIRDYCAEHKISESAFGRAATNDAAFVGALRKGREITPRTRARVEGFLREQARVVTPATLRGEPDVPAPAPAGKPKISAAVIRAAKLDGRDLPTFVTALIDMGLECWRDDRREHGEAVA